MFDIEKLKKEVSAFPAGVNTEIRFQRNSTKRVGFLDGRLTSNSTASGRGVNARIYKSGAYGFASCPNTDEDGVKFVLKEAAGNAELLYSRQKPTKPQFPKIPATQEANRHPQDDLSSQKRLIEFCAEADAYIAKTYKKLVSRSVVASGLNMEKALFTSDGVVAHSFTPRASFYIFMTAEDNEGNMQEMLEPIGDLGCFDEVFSSPTKYYGKIDALYEELMKKCEGVYADAGIKDCVLHPDLAGMLAHEAVGHTVEADFVQSGSVAAHMMNKQVASELINMTDFAHTAFGKTLPVPVYVDDEGVEAKDVKIIENGVLRNYMHNRESAEKFGVEPTGNARAFSFPDEPLIRMRNTFVLPGESKLEEMIASVKDGYYLTRTGNGQADSTGEFMFGVDMGYEIKNGKLGRAIKSTTISGVAFEMLKTVTMVSDDLTWTNCGMCGKKQPIPVSMGGPAIKCKLNVGGR